ncbi:MAG: hypothetical protein IT279_06825 [Ignavibacteriaceae bacterium]|nr:hypothetical protein [Ignavibacteriaceae bacterium]
MKKDSVYDMLQYAEKKKEARLSNCLIEAEYSKSFASFLKLALLLKKQTTYFLRGQGVKGIHEKL